MTRKSSHASPKTPRIQNATDVVPKLVRLSCEYAQNIARARWPSPRRARREPARLQVDDLQDVDLAELRAPWNNLQSPQFRPRLRSGVSRTSAPPSQCP